jgi:transketolase
LKIKGPAYLRIGKLGEKNYSALSDAVLGMARTLSKGTHVSILCTGDVAVEVVNALGILNRKGLKSHAYQFHTIKPIDCERLQYLSQKSRHWVVVEEHIPNGGLFSAVAQWAAQNPCHVEIHRLGAPDRFILGSPKRELLRQRLGIDANSIATHCERLFKSHP